MDETLARNFVIRFFPKYLTIGQKSSKTVIALEEVSTLWSQMPFRQSISAGFNRIEYPGFKVTLFL